MGILLCGYLCCGMVLGENREIVKQLVKIVKSVLEKIIWSVPCVPPETGGILGGRDNIITEVIFDPGGGTSNGYDIYAPDVKMLTQAIQKWRNEKVAFYGMFHTHFPEGRELSKGDECYISDIMKSMPDYIQTLYFPIVLPREEMVVYRAGKKNGQIYIAGEEIEVYYKMGVVK